MKMLPVRPYLKSYTCNDPFPFKLSQNTMSEQLKLANLVNRLDGFEKRQEEVRASHATADLYLSCTPVARHSLF